jgi:hypothetical protein
MQDSMLDSTMRVGPMAMRCTYKDSYRVHGAEHDRIVAMRAPMRARAHGYAGGAIGGVMECLYWRPVGGRSGGWYDGGDASDAGLDTYPSNVDIASMANVDIASLANVDFGFRGHVLGPARGCV